MNEPVEAVLARIELLATGRDKPRNFLGAYLLAVSANKKYPSEPRIWSQLVLLSNLIGQHHQAVTIQKRAKQYCKKQWTRVHDGDCDRDHALYCIKRHLVSDAFRYLRKARRQHKGYLDRLALLHVVEARLWYSWKQYGMALQCFMKANETKEELARRIENGTETEPPIEQWQFNSDRWLLKNLVMLFGSHNQWPSDLWSSLQERMPIYGSPDLNARLQLVMKFGRTGNKIDDFIESSLGQHIINQPQLYWLMRRLLVKA